MTTPITFILLSHPRSGSTALASALGQHPEVAILGEIFNDEDSERKRAMIGGYLRPSTPNLGMESYRPGEDGAEFLRDRVFAPLFRTGRRAAGFKIFYDQAGKDREAAKAWEYLANTTNIHVIHLRRADLIANLLSLELALRDDQWVVVNGVTPRKSGPITLSPKKCQAHFERITEQWLWARETFCKHPFLEIEYDADLCEDQPVALRRVQDFLGVTYHPIVPLTLKQSCQHPREVVRNYCQLERHFQSTSYEYLFAKWSQ